MTVRTMFLVQMNGLEAYVVADSSIQAGNLLEAETKVSWIPGKWKEITKVTTRYRPRVVMIVPEEEDPPA